MSARISSFFERLREALETLRGVPQGPLCDADTVRNRRCPRGNSLMKTRTASHPSNSKARAVNGELRRNADEHAALAILEGRWQILGDAQPQTARSRDYQYVDELASLQLELLKAQSDRI
jgi:hypothetical protein